MAKQDPLAKYLQDETYLGFDFGSKKIGVAVGQVITGTASSLQTIKSINQTPNWEIIGQLIKQWQPTGFV
ncbi:MAG: Holliday junction resolvase RuvX, partial [Methylococcales bacterium]|nr:Holliday junction resolvase RuvX [Methylococcales bacterium]